MSRAGGVARGAEVETLSGAARPDAGWFVVNLGGRSVEFRARGLRGRPDERFRDIEGRVFDAAGGRSYAASRIVQPLSTP